LEVLHVTSIITDTSGGNPGSDLRASGVGAVDWKLHVHVPRVDLLELSFKRNKLSFLKLLTLIPETTFLEDLVDDKIQQGVELHVAFGNVVHHLLPFDPLCLGTWVSGDSVHLSLNLSESLTELDVPHDRFHAHRGHISEGRSLDVHVRFSVVGTFWFHEESLGVHGSALHGGLDFEKLLEAVSLGLEGSELLGVIVHQGLLDVGLDKLSYKGSDLIEFDLLDHVLVCLKPLVFSLISVQLTELLPLHHGGVVLTPVHVREHAVVSGDPLSKHPHWFFGINHGTVGHLHDGQSDLEHSLEDVPVDAFTVLLDPLHWVFHSWALLGADVHLTSGIELALPFRNQVDLKSHTEHEGGGSLSGSVGHDVNSGVDLFDVCLTQFRKFGEMLGSLLHEVSLFLSETLLHLNLTLDGHADSLTHEFVAESLGGI